MDEQPPTTKKQSFSMWYSISTSIRLLWKFRASYAVMHTALGIYLAFYNFFTLLMLARFMDLIIVSGIPSLTDTRFITGFIGYGISLLVNRYILILRDNVNNDFNRKFPQHLSDMLVRKRAALDLAQLDSPAITNLSHKANDNIGSVNKMLDTCIDLMQEAYTVITAAIVLIPYSILLVIINLISAIPEYIVSDKLNRARFAIYDSTINDRRHFYNYRMFLSSSKPMRELKLRNISEYLISLSQRLMNSIHDKHFLVDESRVLPRTLASFGAVAALIISLWYLYGDLITSTVTVGIFTLYIAQMNNIRGALARAFNRFSQLQSQTMYLQDAFKFLATEPELTDGVCDFPSKLSVIRFDNVSFSYPGSDRTVLRDINITIPTGSKVAIVGENGAGKSTFTKLLLRYYDPTNGSILLNDVNLPELRRADWYNNVSYMPQDYNRYPFVLRDVVTLGLDPTTIDEDRYQQAMDISLVSKMIPDLKHGDRTILSPQFEGGTELSVGQSQKVALARILYYRAPILILDEPTSAIDAISELHIFNRIESLPNDVTVFLISHRFNTVKNADIIIVLEHGTIVESGTHGQLMANKNRYYEMYSAQKDSYE